MRRFGKKWPSSFGTRDNGQYLRTAQMAKVKAEVDSLTERRDVEKALLAQAQQENLERRREITRLQADVEEGIAAVTVALGRESDKRRELEEIQQRAAKAIEEINN